jgi:TolA-binding protein
MDIDTSPQPTKLGPYEIRGEIGRGGMAVVYQGIQPSLNRTVAIKVMPEPFAAKPELLARFEREGTIIAQLSHPNLVQVIDRGRDGNTLYIVMEHIDGGGLDTRLAAGAVPLRDVLDWSAQICDALDYAHSVGVVHRDLKPSNILIEMRTRRPKITDFGIAQLETNTAGLATLTLDNTSIGTMNYMSPEQRLDAHRVDHRTDIFSFGVILYQMLTGKLPLGHFKLPSFLRSDLPIGLDDIVTKCLAEAPDDRYQSAAEIRSDLLRLAGSSGAGHDSTSGRRGRLSLTAPQRLYAAVAGLAVLAGLAIVAVLMVRGRGDQGKPASAAEAAPPSPLAATAGLSAPVALAAPVEPVATAPKAGSSPAVVEPVAMAPKASPVAVEPVATAPKASPVAVEPVAMAPGAGARTPTVQGAAPTVAPVRPSSPAPVSSPVAKPSATVVEPRAVATRQEADFARARGLIGSGKYEQAIPILVAMAGQHDPGDALSPEAQFTLAGVCRDMGDRERAVTEYEKLVRVYPTSPRVPDALLGKIRTEWELATSDVSKGTAVIGKVIRAVKKVTATRSYPAGIQQRLVTELQAVQARYAGTPHALAALRLIITVCSPPEMSNDRLAAECLAQLSRLDPEAGPEPLYEAARLYDRRLAEPLLAVELYEQLQSRFPENSHADVVRERLTALRVDTP